jgi:hypothetical protein
MKQLAWQLASSITILTAGIGISAVIIALLMRGVSRERAALKTRAQGAGR